MRVTEYRSVWGAIFLLAGLAAIDAPRAEDLMDLYLRAREFDPAFLAATYDRQIADQGLRESKAEVMPAVTSEIRATKRYQDIKSSDNFLFTEGKTDFFDEVFSINLTQPIYRAAEFQRVPQARAAVRQAESKFLAAEQDLMFRLAQAHFTYLAAVDNLDFAIAERTANQRQMQESEERLQSGLATMTDVHDARARFALAQAEEIDARDALEESRQAIAEITGDPPVDLKVLKETFPLAQPDHTQPDFWVEAGMFQNPNLKALEAAVEIAQGEIRRQKGAYRPNIDLVASFTYSDTGGTVFGGGNQIADTNLGVRVGFPVFDGRRASALTRSAALQHQINLQNLEREKRRVEREIRAAFQGVVSGIDRVRALEQSVFSNEAALAVKEEGMRSGINTGLQVLDARRELFSARRDLAQARYRYILNSLRLKQATGILSVRDIQQINSFLQ